MLHIFKVKIEVGGLQVINYYTQGFSAQDDSQYVGHTLEVRHPFTLNFARQHVAIELWGYVEFKVTLSGKTR